MPLIALPTDADTETRTHGDRIGADEAARILGLTEPALYCAARNHEVPHWRIGRRVRFSRKALEQFIANGGAASRPTDIAA